MTSANMQLPVKIPANAVTTAFGMTISLLDGLYKLFNLEPYLVLTILVSIVF